MMSSAGLASLFFAIILMVPVDARADGGAVRWRGSAGAFIVTIFTSADPVAAGPIDVSVLVQDRADGAAILDGLVKLRVTAESDVGDGNPMLEATATHDAATNKLLYATWIDVGAGKWALRVDVQRGDESSSIDVPLSVMPAGMRLAEYWPHLLLPPLAIVVFVLHQCVVEPRRESA
jgi:hypothetical protein